MVVMAVMAILAALIRTGCNFYENELGPVCKAISWPSIIVYLWPYVNAPPQSRTDSANESIDRIRAQTDGDELARIARSVYLLFIRAELLISTSSVPAGLCQDARVKGARSEGLAAFLEWPGISRSGLRFPDSAPQQNHKEL